MSGWHLFRCIETGLEPGIPRQAEPPRLIAMVPLDVCPRLLVFLPHDALDLREHAGPERLIDRLVPGKARLHQSEGGEASPAEPTIRWATGISRQWL